MSGIKEKYNKIYTDNEDAFGSGKPSGIVRDILEYKKAGSVLEIGAGEGRNSLFLAEQGFNVESVDISDKGIDKLNNAAEKRGLNIKTEVLDINSSFPRGTYDIIVSTFVLHHLTREKALAIINQIKSQTIPNGINAIETFTKDGGYYNNNPNADRFYSDPRELRELYKDWEILEYSETKGLGFKKREDGGPMYNVAAKILARKPTKF